jgi:hypothetical protein
LRNACFVALSAAAVTAAGLSASADEVVARKDGVSVAVAHVNADAAGVDGVELNVEVLVDAAATVYGFRSMRSHADVDCGANRVRLTRVELFDRSRLGGPGRLRATAGDWVTPSPAAYMSDVLKAVCPHGGIVSASLRPVDPPTPAAEAISLGLRPAISPFRSAPDPPARPRAADVAKPAEQASGPQDLRVQLAALDSEAGARLVLDGVRPQIRPPLVTEVEPATVRGTAVYRSVVRGFASMSDAAAFCDRLKALDRACLVRQAHAAASR